MDLVQYLKEKIEKLQLTDKLEIARFIYIKTGELFDLESFSTYKKNSKKQKKIPNKKINPFKVKNYRLDPSSWARLYVKLLNTFDIPAEYIKENDDCVTFNIDDKNFIANMMKSEEDITKIKFGFQTTNFYPDTLSNQHSSKSRFSFFESKSSKTFLDIDKKIGYFKGIETEEVFSKLKKEINERENIKKDFSKLLDEVWETIMYIMNVERPYVQFNSGVVFIKKMLEFFLENREFCIRYTDVYDKDRKEFIGVFVNTYGISNQFFIYEKNEEGFYKLKRASKKKVKKLSKHYEFSHKKVLKLAK